MRNHESICEGRFACVSLMSQVVASFGECSARYLKSGNPSQPSSSHHILVSKKRMVSMMKGDGHGTTGTVILFDDQYPINDQRPSPGSQTIVITGLGAEDVGNGRVQNCPTQGSLILIHPSIKHERDKTVSDLPEARVMRRNNAEDGLAMALVEPVTAADEVAEKTWERTIALMAMAGGLGTWKWKTTKIRGEQSEQRLKTKTKTRAGKMRLLARSACKSRVQVQSSNRGVG